MDCCEACSHDADLPPSCPVALKLCAHLLRHGSRELPHDGGRPILGRFAGKLGQHVGPTATEQEEKGSRPSPRASTANSGSVKSPTAACVEKRIASTGHGGPIHHFFASRPKRSPSAPDQGHQHLEGSSAAEKDTDGATNLSVPKPGSGAGGETREHDASETSGRNVEGPVECTADLSDRGLELHAILSPEEEPGSHRQEPSSYGQDEGLGPRAARDGTGFFTDSVRFKALKRQTTNPKGPNLPVADSGDKQIQQDVGAATCDGQLGHLDDPVQQVEATSIPCQPLGRDSGPPSARPRGVPSSPSSQAAQWWIHLLRECQPHCIHSGREKKRFIHSCPKEKFGSLALETPGFEGLQGTWANFGRQEDAHEFTNALLTWCNPVCSDSTWSTRFLSDGVVSINDHGSTGMPPSLTIGEEEKGVCNLQAVVDAWHEHSGMRTCFHASSNLTGLHLDRFTRKASGAVCRADWMVGFDPSILIPVWNDDSVLTLE